MTAAAECASLHGQPLETAPSPPAFIRSKNPTLYVYIPCGRLPSPSFSTSSFAAAWSASIVITRFASSGWSDASTAARKTADLIEPPLSS